jgi:hypothetical protein
MNALTYVVDGTLELDLKGRLSRVVDLLSKDECDALTLLVIGDVLGRTRSIASLQLSAVDLELVGVENKVGEAIVLVDLGVDGDGTLVPELSAKLDVVEGDGVVRWLGPEGSGLAFCTSNMG